jgi:hypothetical protein
LPPPNARAVATENSAETLAFAATRGMAIFDLGDRLARD